ncbi:MAG: hypothetical protein QOD26_3819 [Betaproteobacteria bacterium]|jgi:hypothetical protein|nr:hypothetical protein [Betaproteobacteria bacterium]
MVNALTLFAGKANKTPGPAFRGISRKGAKAERQEIVRLILALKGAFQNLHGPVINAFAKKRLLRHEVNAGLDELLSRVKAVVLWRIPRTYTPGRPKKIAADIIARVLARNHKTLTGKRATVPIDWDTGKAYGDYLALVHRVFALLGVNANAEACARKATRVKRRKRLPKKEG